MTTGSPDMDRRIRLRDREIKRRFEAREARRRANRTEEQRMSDEAKARLAQLEKQAKRAVGQYTAGVRALYSAGEQLLPDDKHAAALRRLEAERNARLTEIHTETKEIIRTARESLELAGEYARDSVLSASDRSEAAARREFVSAEVERLGGEAMSRRLRAVLRNGSKAEKFLVWEAARTKRERTNLPATGYDDDLNRLDTALSKIIDPYAIMDDESMF